MTAPRLRDARPADAREISPLLEELGHPVSSDRVAEQLERIGAYGTSYFVVVAVAGNEIVGLVSGFATPVLHRERPVGRISVLVVARSRAGKGVGSALLLEAEERLRALGCGRVELTSGAHRADAHAFYGHRGYRQQGVRFVREIREESSGDPA
jgi:GNAT superfamily N-acetyltransferase